MNHLQIAQRSRHRSGAFILEIAIIASVISIGSIFITMQNNNEKKEKTCIEVDASQSQNDSFEFDVRKVKKGSRFYNSRYSEPCSTLIYCETAESVNHWNLFKLSGFAADTIGLVIQTDSSLRINDIFQDGADRDTLGVKMLKGAMLGALIQESRFGPGAIRIKVIKDHLEQIQRVESLSFTSFPSMIQFNLASLPDSVNSSNKRTPESILKTIRQNVGRFQLKYQEKLSQAPDLSGKISLKFTIAPSGKIVAIQIVSSSTECPALDQEILKIASEMEFEKIPKGNTTITYTFKLEQN